MGSGMLPEPSMNIKTNKKTKKKNQQTKMISCDVESVDDSV